MASIINFGYHNTYGHIFLFTNDNFFQIEFFTLSFKEGNNLTEVHKMSFSILPDIPKRKIFRYINLFSIGNRYNASLVWNEMDDTIWESMPTVKDLISRLTDKNGITILNNLVDMETAGILAHAGHLKSLDCLDLRDIDVKSVPLNIFESLTRTVKGLLYISRMTGLPSSIQENLNCEYLLLNAAQRDSDTYHIILILMKLYMFKFEPSYFDYILYDLYHSLFHVSDIMRLCDQLFGYLEAQLNE